MVQFVSYLSMPGIPVKTLSAERAAVLPGRGSHSNKAIKHCSTVIMYSSWTIIRSKYFTNLLTGCDVDAPSGDAWVSHLEREMRLCSTMSAGATWRQESCEIQDVWDKEVWDVCVCVRASAETLLNVYKMCLWVLLYLAEDGCVSIYSIRAMSFGAWWATKKTDNKPTQLHTDGGQTVH